MGYKDEIYTFNGFVSKELEMKIDHYFPCGQRKMFGEEMKTFFHFEVVKNAMTQFFSDKEVQQLIKKRKDELIQHEFTFTSSYEANKYYDIHFIYHIKEDIFSVNLIINSERQLGTINLTN